MKLYINRQRAFDMLSNCKTGALFMKMGAKKIETALEFVKSQQFKVEYVIWIAPAAFLATKTYRNEIKNCSKGLERKIYFFSIEAISCSDAKYLDLYQMIDRFRTFCVVDESLTIKNIEAGRTQRLLKIASKFKYRLILSSAPLTQGLIDLYSQITFMNPSILNMTETQFANNFLRLSCDENNFKRKWSSPEREKYLINLMRPYIYECDLEFDCPIKYTNYNLDETVFKDVIASPKQEGFITSVNLPIVEFKGKITFGIYQRNSKYLTLMTKCFKQHPLINETLVALEGILTRNHCKIYNDKFKTGLRFIKIKLVDKKLQLVFITGRDGLNDEVVKEIIGNIRAIRLQKNIAQKETLELQVVGENPVTVFNAVISKMCNLSAISVVEAKADGASAFMVGTTEYAVPLGNLIDVEAEIARMEAELKHKEGFLQGVLKKLSNEKFVNNAPAAVIEMERKKQADAESIIKSLKESIAALKKA